MGMGLMLALTTIPTGYAQAAPPEGEAGAQADDAAGEADEADEADEAGETDEADEGQQVPDSAESGEPGGDEALVDEARELFQKGAGRYDTADYAGAIEAWTDAYALLPDVPDFAAPKADLSFNIAAAHEKNFAVDGDISHLKQAKILLEKYQAAVPDLYENSTQELVRVAERIAEIDSKIEKAEQAQSAGKDPIIIVDQKPGRGLIVVGSVLTGLGVAGLGTGAAGLAIGAGANDISGLDPLDEQARAAQFQRGRTGNTLGIVGLSAGGVLLGVGVALIAVGAAKNKKNRDELEIETQFRTAGFGHTWSLSPTFDDDGAGAVFSARF